MPICPKCKFNIRKLLAYSEVVNTFELDINGEPSCYGNEDIEGYTDFECPECREKIFDCEVDAIKFLKETDDLQELVAEKINKIKGEK